MRKDQQATIEAIRGEILSIFAQTKRIPTQTEVAKNTGLHINTVHNNWHQAIPAINELMKPFYDRVPDVMKALITHVIETGNPQGARLFFQLLGWSPKTEAPPPDSRIIFIEAEAPPPGQDFISLKRNGK